MNRSITVCGGVLLWLVGCGGSASPSDAGARPTTDTGSVVVPNDAGTPAGGADGGGPTSQDDGGSPAGDDVPGTTDGAVAGNDAKVSGTDASTPADAEATGDCARLATACCAMLRPADRVACTAVATSTASNAYMECMAFASNCARLEDPIPMMRPATCTAHPVDATCTTEDDCCTHRCVGEMCRCTAMDNSCDNDFECCGNMVCRSSAARDGLRACQPPVP